MHRRSAFSITVAITSCLITAITATAADEGNNVASKTKRESLWRALEKSLPEKFKDIDVYGENPSLTAVLFRSNHTTCIFSMESGKVEEVMHMISLSRINRITFDEGDGYGMWRLWYNGSLELSVGGQK